MSEINAKILALEESIYSLESEKKKLSLIGQAPSIEGLDKAIFELNSEIHALKQKEILDRKKAWGVITENIELVEDVLKSVKNHIDTNDSPACNIIAEEIHQVETLLKDCIEKILSINNKNSKNDKKENGKDEHETPVELSKYALRREGGPLPLCDFFKGV